MTPKLVPRRIEIDDSVFQGEIDDVIDKLKSYKEDYGDGNISIEVINGYKQIFYTYRGPETEQERRYREKLEERAQKKLEKQEARERKQLDQLKAKYESKLNADGASTLIKAAERLARQAKDLKKLEDLEKKHNKKKIDAPK